MGRNCSTTKAFQISTAIQMIFTFHPNQASNVGLPALFLMHYKRNFKFCSKFEPMYSLFLECKINYDLRKKFISSPMKHIFRNCLNSVVSPRPYILKSSSIQLLYSTRKKMTQNNSNMRAENLIFLSFPPSYQ